LVLNTGLPTWVVQGGKSIKSSLRGGLKAHMWAKKGNRTQEHV